MPPIRFFLKREERKNPVNNVTASFDAKSKPALLLPFLLPKTYCQREAGR